MFTHLSVLSEKCTTVHGILYSGLPELKYSDEHACLVPNPCLYKPVQITPLFRDTLILHKMDRFPSPTSTWAVQNSLNNVEYLHRIIYCCHWAPRLDFIVTLSLAVLDFLALIQRRRMLPHCTQQPDYALPSLPKRYQELLNYWYFNTSGGSNGVCFRSTLL